MNALTGTSHTSFCVFVVFLLVVELHPEPSVSLLPTSCLFGSYVSRRPLPVFNSFYLAMSQFPGGISPRPRPIGEAEP